MSWFSAAPPPLPIGPTPPAVLRVTNVLGYFLLVLTNILSSTGALGGTNADVSRTYDTPLTPSGYAFAIWGLIFALQGAGVVYQVLPSGYRAGGWKTNVVNRIGYGWQAGWMAQNVWQICFVQQSVTGMWFAGACLIVALAAFMYTLLRLNGTTRELRANGHAGMPALAYVLYKLPTAINTAWLSVATSLGILIIPVAYGAPRGALIAPAAVLTVAVTLLGLWRLFSAKDAAYGSTLIWALVAVAVNEATPAAVRGVGIGCAALLGLGVVGTMLRVKRDRADLRHEGRVPLGTGAAAASDGGGSGDDDGGSEEPEAALKGGAAAPGGGRLGPMQFGSSGPVAGGGHG